MANKKIIELDAASQVNSDAVFPLSQLVGANQKTLKATIAQIQSAVLAPVSSLATLGEASGAIASFDTDISDKLFSCYVNVVASQAGSGTPAPDNVRAISGWSACNLSAMGKNLFDGSKVTTTTSANWGISWNSGNGTLTIEHKNTYSTGTPTMPLNLGAGTYVFSAQSLGGKLVDLYVDGVFNKQLSGGSTFTIEFGHTYNLSFANSSATTIAYQKIQIELGSTATTYSAYNGTTHNIPFNTTVYGGVLDVLSGVLTVTHGIVDLGTLSWTKGDTSTGKWRFNSTAINDILVPSNSGSKVGNICSMYGEITADETWTGIQGIGINANKVLLICDLNVSSASDLQTQLSGQKYVYKLATPTVIQLTPTEVKTILGQNNIFADCGDIDLKYLETIGNRL